MIADVNSPDPEFPLPSEQCLFCKRKGVKGGGIGFAICDLFRYELMEYKTVQYDEYSVCFRCGSVINYVVYIKRLLLTTLFSLPVESPIFTRELPDVSNNFNDNVRFILRCNIQDDRVSPVNGQISSARINGLKSPHLRIQEPYDDDDSRDDTPLLEETHVTYEEPVNIGYQSDSDEDQQSGRKNRSRSVPATSDPEPRTRSQRSKSQLSQPITKAPKEIPCEWDNCTLVFRSVAKYNQHNNEMHRNICPICFNCSYSTGEYLEIHKKNNHYRLCKQCEMPVLIGKTWYHSRQTHNFCCPYCDLRFHRNAHLTEHRKITHRHRKLIVREYKTNNDTNIKIIKSKNYCAGTEIINLNSHKILTELDKTDTNATNVDGTPSLNENSVASPIQQNYDELCRADSGIDSEQERSRVIDNTPEVAVEREQDNFEEVKLSERLETNDDRIDDLPVLFPPGPVVSTISEPPTLVASESPVFQEIRSIKHSPSPVYANTRRSRRRRLNSIADDNPIIPQLSRSKSKSHKKPDDNLKPETTNQPKEPTEYVRRLRKRNAPIVKPSSPSIMNTRSRSRNIRRHSSESEADDHVRISQLSVKKAKYDSDVEVAGSKEEHSQETIESKPEVDYSHAKRRLVKRSEDNLEEVVKPPTVAIIVDENVKVIINKDVVDVLSKSREKDAMVSPTKETTREDVVDGIMEVEPKQDSTETKLEDFAVGTKDIIDAKRTPDALDKEAVEETAKPLEDRISNPEPEQLHISDKKDVVSHSDDFYKLGFYKELDNVKISEKEEGAVNSTTNNIEPIVEIPKTSDTNTPDKTQTDVCNISSNSLEDPESNDSATSWVIHEEEEDEVRPSSVSNQRIPDHERDEKSSNIPVASNMDKIIEAVAMAQDAVSKSKSLRKAHAKNVKPDKSPLKPNKSVGNRIPAVKSVKRVDNTKPIKLSPVQNVEIPAKSVRISSAMNSVAKYMLTTLKDVSFETQSSDSPPYNDNSTILLYRKPSANRIQTNIIDNVSATSNVNRMVKFSFANSDETAAMPLSKIKAKTVRGNIRKERLHRRPTTFDDFILPGDSSKTNPEESLKASDRILKQDVYTFPETDTPSSSDQDTQTDVDTYTGKHNSKANKKNKKGEESATKPQVTLKKKRVISKPKRNTAFDNIITEASQQYLKK